MRLCQFCIFSIRNTILVKLVQRSLCNTRVLNLGINQLMSDLILRLRIESEIDPSSVFELGGRGKTGTSGFGPGTSGNIRILRTWKSISHVLIRFAVSKRYKPLFTLLSRPPRALSLPKP